MGEIIIALMIALSSMKGDLVPNKGESILNNYPLVGCTASSEYCYFDVPVTIIGE